MITVVSGLPRSGTSLMMQMLHAGGHPILCDEHRPADADNPRGYFELKQVRGLERDATWMAQSEGRAIKIISFLLPRLPEKHEYRVIFMRRDLDEILASQEQMLVRLGQPPGPDRAVMRSHFERHLAAVSAWQVGRGDVQIYDCSYAAVLRDPRTAATAVAKFLGVSLDIEQMVQAVDPDLYRQRGV